MEKKQDLQKCKYKLDVPLRSDLLCSEFNLENFRAGRVNLARIYFFAMLPSKSENSSRCSTKLIHVCKKLLLALDCRQNKYSQ